MKIGLFGDIHLRKGGRKIQGWDKRTLDGLDVLKQVVKVFLDEKVDMFIFLGDFFHHRYQVDVQLLSGSLEILRKLKNIEGYFIPGNHDLYFGNSSPEINSICWSSLKWNVIKEITVIPYNENDLILIPFRKIFKDTDYENINQLCNNHYTIVFLHQILRGFPLQKDYVVSEGEEIFDYEKCHANMIISGHTHIPHSKGKVYSIGSVMEHSFVDSDSEEDRGCWILEDFKSLKKICLKYPRYITVDTLVSVKDNINYYRLKVNESEFNKTLSIPDNVQVQVVPELKTVDRLELGSKWNWQDVIIKYIKAKDKSSRYEEVGLSILKEVL